MIPDRVVVGVEDVNESQKLVFYQKLVRYFGGSSDANLAVEDTILGKTVAVWGLAFKPETDDMREVPSIVLIEKLVAAGCKVRAYDPIAMPEAKRRLGDSIEYCQDIYDAALGADALMLLTEWKVFRLPTWPAIKKLMNAPVIFDGRNIYDKKDLTELGFDYHCIGRN